MLQAAAYTCLPKYKMTCTGVSFKNGLDIHGHALSETYINAFSSCYTVKTFALDSFSGAIKKADKIYIGPF